MVRGFLLVVVTVLMVAAVVGGVRWYSGSGQDTRAGPDAACYPLQQTCQWQTGNGEARVTMTPVGGDELQLEATLPGTEGPVIVVLTGENMYMGEYPFRLEATADAHRFRTRFIPPFCSTGEDMVWRIHLRSGQAPVTLPFRLIFSPATH